jgi:hypothetical protein
VVKKHSITLSIDSMASLTDQSNARSSQELSAIDEERADMASANCIVIELMIITLGDMCCLNLLGGRFNACRGISPG